MTIARSDLDDVFGRDNISLWADLNNNGSATDISSRVSWATTLATAHVEARVIPLSYAWADIEDHVLVKHAIVLRAGLLLYVNRSVSDEQGQQVNPMAKHEKAYDKFFKELASGQIALTQERACRPYPAVIDQT